MLKLNCLILGEDAAIPQGTDPHAVAGVIKQFLRELSEPLITSNLYPLFIAAAGQSLTSRLFAHPLNIVVAAVKSDDCAYVLSCLVASLPEENRRLLKYVLKFMRELSQYTETNKMGMHNLATVIGPNIMRGTQEGALEIIQDASSINFIAYELIKEWDEIFKVGLHSFTTVKSVDFILSTGV
jgi:Rho GTPase-activating protein 1